MANTGIDPRSVTAPQANWQLIDVLHETDDWSLALGRWKKEDGTWKPVLAIRWNGWDGSKGSPISRGYPTWFVLPDDTDDLYIGSGLVPPDKLSFLHSVLKLKAAA